MINKIILFFKSKHWKYEHICKVKGHQNVWEIGNNLYLECSDCNTDDITNYKEFHKYLRKDYNL